MRRVFLAVVAISALAGAGCGVGAEEGASPEGLGSSSSGLRESLSSPDAVPSVSAPGAMVIDGQVVKVEFPTQPAPIRSTDLTRQEAFNRYVSGSATHCPEKR